MPGPGEQALQQAIEAQQLAEQEAKAQELAQQSADVAAAVKAGQVDQAVQLERERQAAGGAALADPSIGFSGMVDGQPVQATRGLTGNPVEPLSQADAMALALQNERTPVARTEGTYFDEQVPLAPMPMQPAVGGGGGAPPNDVTLRMQVGTQELDKTITSLIEDQDATIKAASQELLRSVGAMSDTMEKWRVSTEGLDPVAAYRELEAGLNETQFQLDEVRNYFKDLGRRTVDPGRFYANGGGASASVAVAVGALSQAMLGPGAPNTALNIIEAAVERDIRAQEVSLQNAQQAGVGMLNALAQSRQVLMDKQAAMLETKAALRDDMVATMNALTARSNNAIAQQNAAIATTEAAIKSAKERELSAGRLIDATVSTRAEKLRRGHAANVYGSLKSLVERNAAAAQVSAQAAVATPPTQGGELTPDAVAGKKVSRGVKPGKSKVPGVSGVSMGPAAPVGQPEAPAQPTTPKEGDVVTDPSGGQWTYMRIGGRLLPAGYVALDRDDMGNPTSAVTTADPLDRQLYAKYYEDYILGKAKGVEADKYHSEIRQVPKNWALVSKQADKAVNTIRTYLKENPNAVQVNLLGSEGRADLREAVAFLAATRISFYRSVSSDKSALSIQDIARAMGALPEDVTVVSTKDLRAALDAVPGVVQNIRDNAESQLSVHGMHLPPPRGKERTQNLINRAAGRGSLKSVDE